MMHAKADECGPACAAECAGVASFPIIPPSRPGLPLEVWPTFWLDLLAEAWRWRAADIPLASAQSRRDSLADAETLRHNVEYGLVLGGDVADMDIAAVRSWEVSFCRWDRVREGARAAFLAVPALRGEP